jgi:hypothetical protein
MEMSQNMKRGLRSLKGNDTDQRLLGPHPQALACMSYEAGMQPSRHNFPGAAIGQFDASTSDDLEHGLDWTRRGKPNARPTFLLWQKQLAEFSMPTTIKLRRTYYFLNIEMCASLRSKQSYTAHDITSRCRAWACCEPAVSLLCYDTYGPKAFTACSACWEVLQRYPFPIAAIDGQQ